MIRRMVGVVGFAAVAAIPARSVEAQVSVDFSPYATQFRGISSPVGLVAYGPGGPFNITLSVHGYDPAFSGGNPYALIGRPRGIDDVDNDGLPDAVDPTDGGEVDDPNYCFAGNGCWEQTTGAFLNSDQGTLRFTFEDFQTTSLRVFMQFGTNCHDLVWPQDPITCDDGFFGWPPKIRGYHGDGTYVEYGFQHSDIGNVTDVDVGRYYTLTADAGKGFVRFEASGQQVAVGGMEILPEPASVMLMATGLIGVGVAVRRRRMRGQSDA